LRGLGKQLRIFSDHHHGIHARDRLEADDPLSRAAFVRLKYPLQLAYHRLRRRGF
jgi:hypothetical protein